MRIGFTSVLEEGFDNVEWFGRGPHESYIDRFASARVGTFQGSISDQTFKYVRPQENGNKFQTRRMTLKRAAGKDNDYGGIVIAASATSSSSVPMLDMQCHHYKMSDFDGGEVNV